MNMPVFVCQHDTIIALAVGFYHIVLKHIAVIV